MQSTVADEIRSRLGIRCNLPDPAECREAREAAGMSQQEIAQIVGVSKQAVSHWEAGIRTPRGALLYRYAEAVRALQGAV